MQTRLDPDQPSVDVLRQVLLQCTTDAEGWDRLKDNEETRWCIWENQWPDFRKHGTDGVEAKPFENASDIRVYLVDALVNANVDVMTGAFHRAFVRANGTHSRNAAIGAEMTQVQRWYLQTKQNREIEREVELSAQWLETYGWVALHTTWAREIQMRPMEITLDEFINAAALSLQTEDIESVRELLVEAADISGAVELLKRIHKQIIQLNFSEYTDIDQEDLPDLSNREARKIIDRLRTKGVARYPVPVVVKNQPQIKALCPWHEVVIPPYVDDTTRGWVFIRELLYEEELRARALWRKWPKEWVDEAVKTKGRVSIFTSGASGDYYSEPTWAAGLIEVWTAYTYRASDDGTTGVYRTVFSAHFDADQDGKNKDLVAEHDLLEYEHGQVPVVAISSESVARSVIAGRSTVEKFAPWQRILKVTLDGLIDRTTLSNFPPVGVDPQDMRSSFTLAPWSKFPIRPGRQKPQPLDLPRYDVAVNVVLGSIMQYVNFMSANWNTETPAPRTLLRQQRIVNRFLSLWEEAMQQEMALIMQYCTESEWVAITGQPKPQISASEVMGEYRMSMTLDVRELDVDQTTEQLALIVERILPADRGGVIDAAKLVKLALQAINPTLAEELVVSQRQASGELYRQVKMDIALMALGNPPDLIENDPTAESKLQFAQQIIQSNPEYQRMLAERGRFYELVQAYFKNLEQNMKQEQNKIIGRIGVNPEDIA